MATRSAAKLLEALSDWVQEQMAAFPMRDTPQDEMLFAAALKSQVHALRAFDSSTSFDASLAAGRDAFKREVVSSYFARNHHHSPSPERARR